MKITRNGGNVSLTRNGGDAPTTNIMVVESVETYNDKIKKYEFTGQAEDFVHLEELYERNNIRYAFVDNIDKLLSEIICHSPIICAIIGEEATAMATDNGAVYKPICPVYFRYNSTGTEVNPLLRKNTPLAIDALEVVARNAWVGTEDDLLLHRPVYRESQISWRLIPTAQELYTLIYRPMNHERWIRQCLGHELHIPMDLYAKSENTTSQAFVRPELLATYQSIAKTFGIAPQSCTVFLNFSRQQYVELLAGIQTDKLLLYYEQLSAQLDVAALEDNERTWNAIMRWIARTMKIPFKEGHQFSALELKIIAKRRNVIIGRFVTKSCEHMRRPQVNELKLVGDYYECTHGNRVICRHRTSAKRDKQDIREFYEEFGEELADGIVTCKICGEELARGTEYTAVTMGPSIANHGYNEELQKFIYKKCAVLINQIDFKSMVTKEFIQRIISNVIQTVLPYISMKFDGLEKVRGVAPETIGAMKEIVANVSIYCTLIIVTINNPHLIYLRGTNPQTTAKWNVKDYIKFASKHLESVLSIYMQRIKNFFPLNLANSLQIVMQDLNKATVDLPTNMLEVSTHQNGLYEYFAPFVSVAKFPEIDLGQCRDIDPAIMRINEGMLKLLQINKYIGESTPTTFTPTEEFVKYTELMRDIEMPVAHYIRGRCRSYWNHSRVSDYYPTKPLPVRLIENDYIGLIWGMKGGIHRHNFKKATIESSRNKVLLSEIPLGDHAKALYCTICDEQAHNQDIMKAITTDIIRRSTQRYYENYCPGGKSNAKGPKHFNHEYVANVCKFCGFNPDIDKNDQFLTHHKLPRESNQVAAPAKRDVEPIPRLAKSIDIDATYHNVMPKDSYRNLWFNLCAYEDVTYTELLGGKRGDRIVAIPHLLNLYTWFCNILARIVNIVNLPNKALQAFSGHEEHLQGVIQKLRTTMSQPHVRIYQTEETYNFLRNNFISAFNSLPKPLGEFIVKNIIHITEYAAMSEEKTRVEAMVAYKNKMPEETLDNEKIKKKEGLFTFETFDYDGHNEKS